MSKLRVQGVGDGGIVAGCFLIAIAVQMEQFIIGIQIGVEVANQFSHVKKSVDLIKFQGRGRKGPFKVTGNERGRVLILINPVARIINVCDILATAHQGVVAGDIILGM